MITIPDGNCGFKDVPNCIGTHLEKSINPYLKGLIGNFKPYQNRVFYSNRTETSPTVATDIARNGYLANFKHFWNFNELQNLIPDTTNVDWVWNSEITKYNAKGLELETKNALNVYTTAQYGFNKTVTTAVTNNSNAAEAIYHGFEDDSYDESLNKLMTNCADEKRLDFSLLGNLVNDEGLNFSAHTGKKMVRINANTTKQLAIPIYPAVNNYAIQLTKDTTKTLFQIGSEITILAGTIQPNNLITENEGVGSMNLWVKPKDSISNGQRIYNYILNHSFYIQALEDDNYQIITQPSKGNNDFTGSVSMGFKIHDLFGNTLQATTGTTVNNITTANICLKKGIYKVTCQLLGYGSKNNLVETYEAPEDVYYFSFTGGYTAYRTITTQNGCIYNKPIYGTDSMFNPMFTIPLNKQMLFSAWVHESGNNKVNFDSNYIVINGSATQLKPKGAVIDGWQRYEAPFTIASGTNMTLQFVNNSQLPIYFDDIRIHPFNANMKSYVYNPQNLRLVAELDENNYASFYEYDEEGQLVRVKKETVQGIKTIKETRSAKQKTIREIIN